MSDQNGELKAENNNQKSLDKETLREAARTMLRVENRVKMRLFLESKATQIKDSFSADLKLQSNKYKINAIITALKEASEEYKFTTEILKLFTSLHWTQIEYVNIQDDPLYSTGFTFKFECFAGQGFLEIIDFKGQILQAGIKIIYPKKFFSFLSKRDYRIFRDCLISHYKNEQSQVINGIKLYNYANELSQSYASKFKADGKVVNNFNIMNKKNWISANLM